MLLPFQTASVVAIEQATHNTRRFFLQTSIEVSSSFAPGQFITLDLPISDKKNQRLRSYSIANAPNNNGILELVIVLLPGGAGTTYLFEQIRIGSELSFRGPSGHFNAPAILPQQLYMVCTGTGIAPFRSILQSTIAQNTNCHFSLICGVRTQEDLLYHIEMEALAASSTNFTYLPTLSREQWHGATGYVHEHYAKLCAGQAQAEFMLCGWRAMVDEARAALSTMGYAKQQIHFELYG